MSLSDQISRSVASDSLQPHGLQPTRLLCPSLSPRVCSNSCPLSQWGHLTISSSVVPFSSCLQSFPASASLLMSWLLESGGQSIGASAEAFQWIFKVDFLYDWLIGSPCCPRDSEESSLAPQFESIDFLALSLLYGYMTTGKTIVLTIWTFVRKVMSLLFNTLSRNFPVAHMVKNLFAM